MSDIHFSAKEEKEFINVWNAAVYRISDGKYGKSGVTQADKVQYIKRTLAKSRNDYTIARNRHDRSAARKLAYRIEVLREMLKDYEPE